MVDNISPAKYPGPLMFYESDSIKVGNVFEKSLEDLFQDKNFSHFTHVVHYLQRRNK